HVKHVALLATGQAPDVYVKSYIRPDPQNLTKRKTQVVKASQNPTFNREMYYENVGGEHVLSTRVLEVSVWNSAGLMDNNKLYVLYIPLQKLKNRPEDRKELDTSPRKTLLDVHPVARANSGDFRHSDSVFHKALHSGEYFELRKR
ncbi:unnamed protein product, partial [Heligmosomoides polygyrus]|uniref:C2 domain-containing protein n=1 Tax=Heligmosomoides polygyrus TaxID=6339 RepID=A0A183GUG6_HELPZ